MKNTLISMILVLSILGVISSLYSGENYEYSFSGQIINCSIINNTFNLDGINLTWDFNKVYLKTDVNLKPDKFNISCYTWDSEEVIQRSYGGASGRRIIIPSVVNGTNQTSTNQTINNTLNVDDNESIYDEINDFGNVSIDDVKPNNVITSIGNFFKNIFNKIGNFFRGIFK